MLSFPSSTIISYIFILLAIAFFTLFERKILSYIQIRKGPNKVRVVGIPQPLSDALKLIIKELIWPTLSNKIIFSLTPFFTLILTLLLWFLYPLITPIITFKYGILFFICISSLRVYTTLAAGWASNSKYALLGSLRRIAQTISYEVRISLILITPLILFPSFDIQYFSLYNNSFVRLILPIIFIFWIITILAELNRAPFDLTEGERELVSGFNTEYSGGLFTLIFIAEYLNILFISALTSLLFINHIAINPLFYPFITIKILMISTVILWVRGTLPRIRYDTLINLTWKALLPFALLFIIITLFIY